MAIHGNPSLRWPMCGNSIQYGFAGQTLPNRWNTPPRAASMAGLPRVPIMPALDFADAPPLLAAHGLAYARNEEPIFGPLDFSLASGEVVLIEGDNGSGKTTLLKVLSGLLEPTSGEVLLNGVHLTLAKLSHQVALL